MFGAGRAGGLGTPVGCRRPLSSLSSTVVFDDGCSGLGLFGKGGLSKR